MSYPFLSKKYKIRNLIGQGAFGKSYLAEENDTNKLVVVKVVEDDKLWENIKNNEKLLCSIDNDYIMRIYKIDVFESYRCIIQEYVEGENLNTYISNNDLTLNDLMNISYGVLKAIECLERSNLSHKDIKPSNIIYDKDKKISKLIDLDYMGVLRLSNQNYVGTIKYSSPEQLIDNRASNKADIYSFGMVLCFMILGDIPFDVDLRKTGFQIKKQVESTLKEISNLSSDIANKIVDLVNGLLEYSAIERLTPARATQQVEEIMKKSDEEAQGSVLIRKHLDECSYISDDLTHFTSMLETSVAIMDSTGFNDFVVKPSWNHSNSEKKRHGTYKTTITNNIRQENKNIYRKQLLKEYDNILLQAKISFGLWIFSFFICFGIIFVSVYAIMAGNYTEGIITIVLDGTVMAIQKLFNIREDHYRKLMEQKIKHLETGDYLDYAFEKVEKIDNPEDKNREILELIKTIREHAPKYEGNV